MPGRRSLHTTARRGPEAGEDEPRSVPQPLRAAVASATDVRRYRSAVSGGAGAARSHARAANAPVVSVVDIHTVRLVANLVEKDVKRIASGTPATVEVDAFPGDTFSGKVSRVAPVFDPATRTAEMEIEVPNPGFRLKPGMYARVNLTVNTRANALTVPRNALVDIDGRSGVFVAGAAAAPAGTAGPGPAGGGPQNPEQKIMTAKFQPVETGLRDGERIEITAGLTDGARVVTTGATALKDGDRIVTATSDGGGGGERTNNEGAGPRGARQGSGR
ncbi:MAG: efflux RND transporter periplasmic adaptor subunit [Acidobacteria bacterium]|nr:efflux RND transporter periplasmic adaptor subunit [Acidobacteriota bacterium]